jgi:ribosome-associated heat shock protein Hsp15
VSEPQRVRLDRWLWAARFFRTRAQARAAIESGKVHLLEPGASERAGSGSRGRKPKPAREVTLGDRLVVRRGHMIQTVTVVGMSEQRRGAPEAATLYSESAASIEAREAERARRMMERAGLNVPAVRPGKRDRRERVKLKQVVDADPGPQG